MANHASWPRYLYVVRHGESAGNVARDAAEAAGHFEIEIAERDADVPLSPRGEQQAEALGRWFGALEAVERPTVVLTSPYRRAEQTASRILARMNATPATSAIADERLREKEFGALDRLTRAGIAAKFPHEVEQRRRLGKFYYRAPGGESWCDVILRLRSVVQELQLREAGSSVLIVAHQVTILGLRYLIERLTEKGILAIDAQGEVANCSVTSYRLEEGETGMVLGLSRYNSVEALDVAGAGVTSAPDAPVGTR